MATTRYECTKCRHNKAETGEIRTTGSGWSRFFNLQNHKFGYAACASCGYTEFYRMDGGGKGMAILDILGN
ncbi:MAG: zinc ribbon domain-containing protein [Acidimicrobiales bacterium]|jgi:predicted nucleic-acid-binding Zn-ribbon protein|nr:zinc ribbon domain-containing protein [Acidimicrobiales bacterium]|tara:strand:- start:4803 stop:5015 length:213 start_codon:yes stop_codon:yes gene_type:complete